jgi:alpha-L-fucosidase 2
MPPLLLKYHAPAEDSAEGWERFSLPLGNGYLGANIFGRVDRERIQITENSLENPGHLGGLNNFAELYLRFDHAEISGYERGLSLDDGVAYCRYTCGGIDYSREYFTSYPDKVLVVKLTASQAGGLSFVLCPEIPFVKEYAIEPGDGGGKSGTVVAGDDTIILSGTMYYYAILFDGRMTVRTESGTIVAGEGTLTVEDADSAVIVFALGTNYVLDRHVFLEEAPQRKLRPEHPGDRVAGILQAAVDKGYDTLKARHLADYRALFGRVALEIDGECPDLPTDELLRRYSEGEALPYLEALFFQYGRYLLIGSSRPGCLPCNLQGVWNCHDQSPWGSGYWHNINVQMNYWPAFNTNLAELFTAYVDFYTAFRPRAEAIASQYIRENNPENYVDTAGACGWTIGTGNYAYSISGPGGHSGPGTGGLTTKLFWDYYDFTRDETVLREIAYPALLSMSHFLTKTVRDYDGKYLTSFSASPEQMIGGKWAKRAQYYHTVGCAFDQQMIYENGRDFLDASDLLGEDDESVQTQRRQIANYAPVEIGWSGQIKEYAEEHFYGEIGEYTHRHISQLVALYPGTLITRDTPAWMDAAKTTLNERGDDSTGWALAHRLNAWARTGDGNRAYKLLRQLLGNRTLPNLWDTHPPFQIDGNLGGTSGIAEMLLQSHEGYIAILPALPDTWPTGRFAGLVARGGCVLSVAWRGGVAQRIDLLSPQGGRVKLAHSGLGGAVVTDAAGQRVGFDSETADRIAFDTTPGGQYVITGMRRDTPVTAPRDLIVSLPEIRLAWEGDADVVYNVYRAVDGAPGYETVADRLATCWYEDAGLDFSAHEIVTYKVTACRADGSGESQGPVTTINHATPQEIARYQHRIRQLNK